MKKQFLFASLILLSVVSFANHITGGEMYYVHNGVNANGEHTYEITLKLYRDCYAPAGSAQLDPSVVIGIYNKTTGSMQTFTVQQTLFESKPLTNPDPCITNPPPVCYEIGYYRFTATLPASTNGYTIVYQRCCRIIGINNIAPNSNQHGATYTAEIPGSGATTGAPVNNSAKFGGNDLVVICANTFFKYDFSAVDADGDELRYSFCNAYIGGSQGMPVPQTPSAPPFTSIPYQGPFNGSQPLGGNVTIDPQTGEVSGIAPAPGIYVVTVCVAEYRNGKLIATQRKDLQIKIGDCNVAQAIPVVFDINGARMQPGVAGCRSFTYSFANDVPPNPAIHSYYWEFSDGATYTVANPTHTFADTGAYTIKLTINRGEPCSAEATSTLKVYPGFTPDFSLAGVCAGKPTRFTDASTTNFGVVNGWRWDFGNTTVDNDTSRLQNPTYTYPQEGTYNLQVTVTTSKGCKETITRPVEILTKPPLSVAFKDTLICNGDRLQLEAIGIGNFTWTPGTNIANANTATPTVFPTSTTRYFVELNDQGCLAQDTVNVRVVNFVTLQAMPDTIICAGDDLRLYANTDGLQYQWSPTATIDDPSSLQPLATPTATTTYTIQSTIGGCNATDNVVVTLVPYPAVNAGTDTVICYNSTAQLNGSHNGSTFNWSPVGTLSGANTLTPVARPTATTAYVLYSFDTRGCPKAGSDTVVVVVNPEVVAFAGRDTAVVVGQELQLSATGGEVYDWWPPNGLSSTIISNPIGKYNGSFDSIRYFVTVQDAIGCTDVASIGVKIFKTAPRVFVPSAFTPNNDGRNDVLRPIAVGLTNIEYFRVYNRWGQLVFETKINGKGWDGKIQGKPQGTESYAWIVKGQDYTGKTVFEKGTVTLIR
ncbi:gliding motility-associated C-terminal domain-containing protein [Flavisolibacter sp. BT320]|nr:gliding motility-associated C-terminal domain-containing protein [Flavisolibacter longurius]